MQSSQRSPTHSRLAQAFTDALPQFAAVNPLGYTFLTHFTGLDRCYVNIPVEALDMQGIERVTLPFGAFFGRKRPSDHLPIIMQQQGRPRPLVLPLPRAHALADSWKDLALQELGQAAFGELSCLQAATMLPILLRRASWCYRRASEQLDAKNDELCLYFATRFLRCVICLPPSLLCIGCVF